MKFAFAVLTGLLTFSAYAQDLAVSHAKICDGLAENSCQVIFTVSAKPTNGMCVGKLRNTIPCTITYNQSASSKIQVKCGQQAPLAKDEIIAANGQSYKVSALVKKTNKKDVLVNDPTLYTYLEGKSASLFLTKSEGITAGSVVLKEKGIPTALTGVTCY